MLANASAMCCSLSIDPELGWDFSWNYLSSCNDKNEDEDTNYSQIAKLDLKI
ncbi:hypothetical protein DPMN_105755 [Dreissena polymorpha]|uniref:Uncharacterized protein n=1 Tax=Dreissena polymorpha TaxID=45954 RepID=A0A9D4K3U6_DREPO|nr:hypothetical protein DPMN_105755 [Dreissena polymorpha]